MFDCIKNVFRQSKDIQGKDKEWTRWGCRADDDVIPVFLIWYLVDFCVGPEQGNTLKERATTCCEILSLYTHLHDVKSRSNTTFKVRTYKSMHIEGGVHRNTDIRRWSFTHKRVTILDSKHDGVVVDRLLCHFHQLKYINAG